MATLAGDLGSLLERISAQIPLSGEADSSMLTLLEETKLMQRSLVASGFRLANEFRKLQRLEQEASQGTAARGNYSLRPVKSVEVETAAVIDIRKVLQIIKCQQEGRR